MRVLVGLMILPAAAVIFVLIPAGLVGLHLYRLSEEPNAWLLESDFDTWVVPVLPPLLLTLAVVFVRACWAHHRESSGNMLLKLWLMFGGLLVAGWAALTAIEFGTKSELEKEIHYLSLLCTSTWLATTASWGTGRIASRVLARLEHSRSAAR